MRNLLIGLFVGLLPGIVVIAGIRHERNYYSSLEDVVEQLEDGGVHLVDRRPPDMHPGVVEAIAGRVNGDSVEMWRYHDSTSAAEADAAFREEDKGSLGEEQFVIRNVIFYVDNISQRAGIERALR